VVALHILPLGRMEKEALVQAIFNRLGSFLPDTLGMNSTAWYMNELESLLDTLLETE